MSSRDISILFEQNDTMRVRVSQHHSIIAIRPLILLWRPSWPPNGLALSCAALLDRESTWVESSLQNRPDLARRLLRQLHPAITSSRDSPPANPSMGAFSGAPDCVRMFWAIHKRLVKGVFLDTRPHKVVRMSWFETVAWVGHPTASTFHTVWRRVGRTRAYCLQL